MGLFDIFRRHKNKEKEEATSTAPQTVKQEEPVSEEQASVEKKQSQESSASSATDKPQAINIPPAVSREEQFNSDGTSEVLHDGVESGVSEEEASAQPVSAADSDKKAVNETVETEIEASEEPAQEDSEADSKLEASPSSLADQQAAETTDDSSTPEEDTVSKYDHGLEKSRTGFGARLNKFLANFRHVDEDFFDDLEDMLIESDVGYDMAMKLSDQLREEVKLQNAKSKQDVSNVIIEKMVELYEEAGQNENPDLTMAKEGPTVIMFVGVNGAGKTTTIGKMAALFKKQGKKVLLAAADTFRAGATEQLDVWAKRDGVDIVVGPENGDPAAVVFDAVKKLKTKIMMYYSLIQQVVFKIKLI